MQEKVMKKIKCNLSIAKKLIRIVETLQIAAQLKTTYALADKEWNKRNGRSGIIAEKALIRLFKKWGIKARRLPRSGKPKKTKRPKLQPDKPCDIKLTIDNKIVMLESKLRSIPWGLYNDIQKKPRSYKIHHLNEYYYVLPEDDFRQMIVELIEPKIVPTDRRVSKYHDLFNETPDKERYIDIVALKQKMYSFVFFIRPNTYEYLIGRCTSNN